MHLSNVMHRYRPPTATPAAIARVFQCALAVGLIGTLPTADAYAQEPTEQQPPKNTRAEVIPAAVVFMAALSKEDDDTELQAELRAEFDRQLAEIAEEHGLLVVDAADAPELTVRLQLEQLEQGANNYVIYSTAIYHDKVETEVQHTCLHCLPADVVANALTNVIKAADAVIESRAEIEAASAEASAVDIEPAVPPPPPPRVRVLGAASYVGISSLALGLGSAIAGAVFLDRGVVTDSDSSSVFLQATDYRRPGAALMGVGLGMMVVGNVLLSVDLAVLLPRRRARARARLDGVSVTAANGPGFAVFGRF